jgi:hypothetical protein
MASQIPGWILAGSHPHEYDHGLVEGEDHAGKRIAFLRCNTDSPGGFGTLMQIVDAHDYRGKRIHFGGSVRPHAVDQWAGLWMRVDGPAGADSAFEHMQAFDNMQNRPITGSGDWQEHHVVLDVGETSSAVAFGVLLVGSGEVRCADFRFEEVGLDVPTTGSSFARSPENLDFSAP